MLAKDAFHLSELTGQPIPIIMRISLLIKLTIQISQILNIMHKEAGFSSWKKPISLPKCLVRPWSDRPVLTFGKRPTILLSSTPTLTFCSFVNRSSQLNSLPAFVHNPARSIDKRWGFFFFPGVKFQRTVFKLTNIKNISLGKSKSGQK